MTDNGVEYHVVMWTRKKYVGIECWRFCVGATVSADNNFVSMAIPFYI